MMFVYDGRCQNQRVVGYEELQRIYVLQYTLWLYCQQLLAVRFVLEQ